MSDEYYDEDGFRLEFEDDTSEQEKQFFMRAFPNVNKIAERKVHCTSCYMHLGTAPITEAIIRMHPVLRVSHCRNCHTFYNSGEFDKGEDGSELYCRWCGQGGEVYCCSKCPYVFCKKCIVQNLSRACVQDISRNDNWQCFSCAPKIMWHLRAQHWALVNYIEKQKKEMKDKNLSVQTINTLMKQDNTTCCSGKGLNKKASTPVSAKKAAKRPSDANDFSPGAAKIPENKRAPPPRPIMPAQQNTASPPAAKKAKTADNNEVVCTPDIMSMFMSPEEPPPLVATRALPPQPVKSTPPPAPPKPTPVPTIPTTVPGRQVVVRPAIPANQASVTMRMPGMANTPNAAPPPVYHTINGYRIDLHTAAQQGTYRLPNGKLIQVRKQAPTATPTTPTAVTAARNIAPKPPNTYYNPVNVNPQTVPVRMTNGGSNMHINIALQQQQQLQEQRLQQQRQQQQQQQQQQQLLQQQRQQQLLLQQAQAGQPQPTIVAGQINPALQLPTLALLQNMVNGPHEDSPLGKSRKNFEGKLLSGVEICQHIVNKINTLTNSNSFKNIRNVRDLKELYIHVSYLLTYAIGRFKTLQEKCVDDVKKMGFTKESDFVMMGEQISNRNPDEDKSDDEDDCEIIETNTTLIELDSEDEEDATKKKKDEAAANKAAPCPKETEAAVAAILQEKDDANTSIEPIAVDSEEQITTADKDSSAEASIADKVDSDKIISEANSSNEVVSVDSTESVAEKTNVEKSKSNDDLVEIIDGDDENVEAPSEEATGKADEAEKTNAANEQQESAQEKMDSASDKDNAVEVSAEGEKESEKQTEVPTPTEEEPVLEADGAQADKAPEVESVEMMGEEAKNDNKENELLPKDSTESEAIKESDNSEQQQAAEASDKMEVDAQIVDKDQTDVAVCSEEKSSESEDASAEDATEDTLVLPVAEQSTTEEQPETEAHGNEVSEPEAETTESPEEPSNQQKIDTPMLQIALVESLSEISRKTETETSATADVHAEPTATAVNDECTSKTEDGQDPLEVLKAAEDESPTAKEPQAKEETPTDEVKPKEDDKQTEAEVPVVEVPADEDLDTPTGNELFAQIEDSFLKLQEMIDSTEEATGDESTAAELEPAVADQEMTEESSAAPSAEVPVEEQMEVDNDESPAVTETEVSAAAVAPEEDSQETISREVVSTVAEEKTAHNHQILAECNGVLDQNGTNDSNESSGDLERMSELGSDLLEMGKMVTGQNEIESVNSPEMISGDY